MLESSQKEVRNKRQSTKTAVLSVMEFFHRKFMKNHDEGENSHKEPHIRITAPCAANNKHKNNVVLCDDKLALASIARIVAQENVRVLCPQIFRH